MAYTTTALLHPTSHIQSTPIHRIRQKLSVIACAGWIFVEKKKWIEKAEKVCFPTRNCLSCVQRITFECIFFSLIHFPVVSTAFRRFSSNTAGYNFFFYFHFCTAVRQLVFRKPSTMLLFHTLLMSAFKWHLMPRSAFMVELLRQSWILRWTWMVQNFHSQFQSFNSICCKRNLFIPIQTRAMMCLVSMSVAVMMAAENTSKYPKHTRTENRTRNVFTCSSGFGTLLPCLIN